LCVSDRKRERESVCVYVRKRSKRERVTDGKKKRDVGKQRKNEGMNVCVSEREERGREIVRDEKKRNFGKQRKYEVESVCIRERECVCVKVKEREKESEGEREREREIATPDAAHFVCSCRGF